MTKPYIGIIDYGMGNLFSVKHACEFVGVEARITNDIKTIESAAAVILPGVGAFADAIQTLRVSGMDEALHRFAESGKPTVGICLGMQLFSTASQEFGEHKGLDLISGTVERFTFGNRPDTPKIPRVGWGRIQFPAHRDWEGSPLKELSNGEHMYFVHSYCVKPVDRAVTLAVSEYGGVAYCAAYQKENVIAFQFHPERSGKAGIAVYKNLAEML